MAEGQIWLFPFDTEWLRRHITLLESLGPFANLFVFAPMYPEARLISEVDATSACATALFRSRSPELQVVGKLALKHATVRDALSRAFIEHGAGIGNITDPGSRGKWTALLALAAAFAIRLRYLPLPAELTEFFSTVLRNTSPVSRSPASNDPIASWLSFVDSLRTCCGALVCNIDTDSKSCTVVDRSSPWGNFSHVVSKKAAPELRLHRVAGFTASLISDVHRSALVRAHLRGCHLGCHCSPLLCHGHVLAFLANASLADVGSLRLAAELARQAGWRSRDLPHLGYVSKRLLTSIEQHRHPSVAASFCDSASHLAFSPVRASSPRLRPSRSGPTAFSPVHCHSPPQASVRRPLHTAFSPAGTPSAPAPRPSATRAFSPTVSSAPSRSSPRRQPSFSLASPQAFEPLVRFGELDPCGFREVGDDFAVSPQRSASPQPTTARAARAAASRDVASRLLADDSPDAICRGQKAKLQAMCAESHDVLDAGRRHGTSKADEWGFKKVMEFAKAHPPTRWMRPRDVLPDMHFREAYFVAFAICWLAVSR